MSDATKEEFLQMLDEEAEKEASKASGVIEELAVKHHYLSGRLSFLWLERIIENIASEEVAGFYFSEREAYFGTLIDTRSTTFWAEQAWFDALKKRLEARKLFLVDNKWIGWSY